MDGVTTVTDHVPPEPTTLDAAWGALYRALAESDRRDMWPDIRRILDEHRPAIEAEARASQPLTLDVDRLREAAEALWGVVANASHGEWSEQSQEWQDAAVRARDLYFAASPAGTDT